MMLRLPTEIWFGPSQLQQLPLIIEMARARRPLLVSDGGVAAAGHVERTLELCSTVDIILDIEPNPRHLTINRLAEKVRNLAPDLIIGLGGGSVLDASKALALLATNPGNIEDYEGREKYEFLPLPLVAIPTTCGSGSEVSWVSVITHTERRFKMSIKGRGLFPRWALLDPNLLLTLPPALVAATGLDALTHAVEAVIVKPANAFSDLFAKEAISLIFNFLPKAYFSLRDNPEAREKMLMGSTLAGIAFCNADVGAVHCLSEALGGLFDAPHGVANAIFLPVVLEYMAPAVKRRLLQISHWVGLEGEGQETINLLLQKIKELVKDMKIPQLGELGIRKEDFTLIARAAALNNSNPSNPRLMTEADYIFLLTQAYEY